MNDKRSNALYIFGGLPGAGKSELAGRLAGRLGAVWLRIDTIEQAMREGGLAPTGPEGYRVAWRVAADNLRLGRDVVADSVNPIAITREAWRGVAAEAGVRFYEIETACSDKMEHRARVENRPPPSPGFRLPTWAEVVEREYELWTGAIHIDTAGREPGESLAELEAKLGIY